MDFMDFRRGVLAGGLIGDCYGYLYEKRKKIKLADVLNCIQESVSGDQRSQIGYSDDTQMGWGLLKSLNSQGKFNPEDVAREFANNFLKDGRHRYYGGGVRKIFRSLAKDQFRHPFKFAERQFKGTGSYGNGGAMRISPAAVYCMPMSENEFETFVVDVTRLTHTHPLGICGALLQAFAVRHLWYNLSKMSAPIDADSFLDGLLERLRKVQYNYVDFGKPAWKGACDSYTEKFCQIKSLLARTDSVPISEVAGLLGNNLEAVNSVPTAIYAFLRSLEPIAGIPFESVLLRCLAYTISLGGDTDTIGTMACSLAGGYCGFKDRTKMNDPSYSVPPLLLARCEGAEMISEYAEWTLPLRSPNACGSVTTDADKTDSSQPLKDTVVQSGCKRTAQQEEESSVSDCKKTKREPANNDQ